MGLCSEKHSYVKGFVRASFGCIYAQLPPAEKIEQSGPVTEDEIQ